jgi:Transposase domain (DUF772)
MRGQAGFWDIDERYARLSEAGDPLEKLNAVVPWEVFRKPLAKALKRSDGAKGGRPPYDPVMMFKIMVLQALYSLSDDQAEFQIQDRLSFMRFLGLGLGERVPDAKTIWLFREHLTQAGAVEKLFARFASPRPVISQWAGRSSMRQSWRRRSRGTLTPRRPTSRQARYRTPGGTSPRNCARRIGTRVGR